MNWEDKELQEIAKIIDSCLKLRTIQNTEICHGLESGRVKEGYLSLKNTLKVSKEVYDEFTKNHKPQINDIVMSRVGTYFVNSFVETEQPFCLGQSTSHELMHSPSRILSFCIICLISRDYQEANRTITCRSQVGKKL